ncbi:E3 ubiquitin-protein ligase LUL4 [Actinidia chinensis var. chinensis]|uniref:E3 ubiquitin-protein ligase LUL4 n=1 Tax=Actinidia chinensis var. chinensis TaxID=1590841 RepID=A0A2R6P6V3_ACTCC|nr:E3 ubiquitin-protein ligase LUL4 [Actinidia chinensis var. chinensis]
MESGGGGNRRRRSPSDEKIDSPNLRDFLKVKEDRDGRNLAGLTLGAVIGGAKRPSPAQVNRTLIDVIRDDPNSSNESKKRWKAIKDKLRLRRAGAAWTSTVPIPASDVPIQNANRMISRRNSTRFPAINSEYQLSNPELSSSSLSSINGGENTNHAEFNSMSSNRAMLLRGNSSRIPSLAASRYGRETEASTSLNTSERNAVEPADLPSEDEEEEEREDRVAEEGEEAPVRTSLMALLAETDGSSYMMDDDDDEEEDDEEEEGKRGLSVGEYNNCCVCMVRHKGAAFIPCGHTFCRLCSRELWVQRGNCPLCNGFILEILDIF